MSDVENNFKKQDINLISKDINLNSIRSSITNLNINNTSNLSSDLHYVSEIRVGVIGSVDSGKSTLTGVLTKNVLDNGRGSARNYVLKHPLNHQ